MNHIRFVVNQRDKGVCAQCQRDTYALKADYHQRLCDYWDSKHLNDPENRVRHHVHASTVRQVYWDKQDCPRPPEGFPADERNWWEADHITPVVEGGGGCGPEGYRTLCIPCHKAETKALAGRRAIARKAKRTANAPELTLTLASQ